MGNCQAVDAAALVIQHPSGKIERMYWPIPASEVMKTNPGHYVSIIIPLPVSKEEENNNHNNKEENKTVKFTRVKLLRPSDTLVLGRAYRLVTTQEVMKVLRAKRIVKMKKKQQESRENSEIHIEEKSTNCEEDAVKAELKKIIQEPRHERHQQRLVPTNLIPARPKSWRPSLGSISEGGS